MGSEKFCEKDSEKFAAKIMTFLLEVVMIYAALEGVRNKMNY